MWCLCMGYCRVFLFPFSADDRFTAMISFVFSTVVKCGRPPVSHDVIVDGESFSYGDQVTFRCSSGYLLNGSNAATCAQDGDWQYDDGGIPTCPRKDIFVGCTLPGPDVSFFY